MRWNRKSRLRLVIAMCVAGLAGVGMYAYTAQNTVQSSYAGIGAGAIDGYTASNLSYTLNTANPQTIDSVSFTLSNVSSTVPSTVQVQLSPGGTWYTCPASLTPSCTTSGESAAGATQFTVVAVK